LPALAAHRITAEAAGEGALVTQHFAVQVVAFEFYPSTLGTPVYPTLEVSCEQTQTLLPSASSNGPISKLILSPTKNISPKKMTGNIYSAPSDPD